MSDHSQKDNEFFESTVESISIGFLEMAQELDLKAIRYFLEGGILKLCAKIIGIFQTYSHQNDPLLNF